MHDRPFYWDVLQVRPPVCVDLLPTQFCVVLSQDPYQNAVPALITAVQDDGLCRALVRYIPRQVTQKQIFLLAGSARRCLSVATHVHCMAWIDDIRVTDEPVHVNSGRRLHVSMFALPSCPQSVPHHGDVSVLMQVAQTHPSERLHFHEASWLPFAQALQQLCWQVLDARVWYVHHVLVPTCAHFRVVPLTREGQDWARVILDAWADQIRVGEPVHLTMVDPLARTPGFPGINIIVWQRPVPNRVVGIAASTIPTSASSQTSLVAGSVPDSCLAGDLMQLSSLTHSVSRLHVWYLQRRYSADDFVALFDGATWTIEQEPQSEDPPVICKSLCKCLPVGSLCPVHPTCRFRSVILLLLSAQRVCKVRIVCF